MLRIRTLGGLSVEQDGTTVAGAAAQPRRLAILAVLARAGQRGASRERLLALLWPDSNEEASRNTLNHALYTLRRDLASTVEIRRYARNDSPSMSYRAGRRGIFRVPTEVPRYRLSSQAADRSTQSGLCCAIRSSFRCRRHPLISFSRAMASRMLDDSSMCTRRRTR